MPMAEMKCDGYAIVMQEIPDEITLAINVTGCPYHCVGCHSPHLWEDYGDPVDGVLKDALIKYGSMVSCVCFMGGDQCMSDLASKCQWVKRSYPNLKLALYSGADDFYILEPLLEFLDYVKIGRFVEELGGLASADTNQRMFAKVNNEWNDITYKFWRTV